MARILHVRHPAPVTFRPTGSRRERRGFKAIATPVELPEASPDAFQPVITLVDQAHEYKEHVHFHAHAGGLWVRVQGRFWDEGNRLRFRPFAPDDFISFLTGDREFSKEVSLERHLRRTPLIPLKAWAEDFSDPPAERIVADASAAAADALRAFVEGNLRIVGNEVFTRVPGPLAMPFQNVPKGRKTVLHDTVLFPRMRDDALAIRMDRVEEQWRILRPASDPDAEFPGYIQKFDPALLGDDDVAHFVNRLPGLILQKGLMAQQPRIGEGLADDLAAMRAWEVQGVLGAVPLTDAEAVMKAGRGMIHAFRDVCPASALTTALELPLRWIEEIGLPRLYEHGHLPEADADAFTGLGM